MTTNHGHGGPGNDGMDDFDFDAVDAPVAPPAPRGAARPPAPASPGFEGDFDFDAPPEPQARGTVRHPQEHDDFDDVGDGGDAHDPHANGGMTTGAAEEYGAADAAEAAPVAPAGGEKTLVQRLWFPAALGMVALIGVGGAWEMGFLGGDASPADQQAQVAQVAPQVLPQTPRVPPAQPPRIPAAPALPVTPPASAGSTPSLPVAAPAATTAASPAGGFVASGSVEAAVNRMVDATKGLNATLESRFTGLEGKLGEVQSAIATRLDATDGKVNEVHSQVAAVEGRIGDFESRLSAIENGRAGGAVRPASMGVGGGVNQRARMPAAPDAAQDVLRGFALRGVARGAVPGSAYVEVPGGQFFLVHVGDNLKGAGQVTGIRREGASWVLATDQGIIRP